MGTYGGEDQLVYEKGSMSVELGEIRTGIERFSVSELFCDDLPERKLALRTQIHRVDRRTYQDGA